MIREPNETKRILGPILHFRGESADRWRLSALFVFDGAVEPDDLIVEGVKLPVAPRHVFVWRNRHIWRFVFTVTRTTYDRQIKYGFSEHDLPWTMTVPGQNTRLRLAYTASNGFHDEPGMTGLKNGTDGMWVPLLKQHATQPYHLLIQGGDQIHADNVWRECPALAQWWSEPNSLRYTQPFTRTMADQTMDYYFNTYCTTLAKPPYAKAMASIPSIMMWDDHDIFDGWGSRPDEEHQSQVYRGLFAVARRQFSLFQLGASVRDPLESAWGAEIGTFTQGFRIGDVGILMLDLRSERTRHIVLGAATWQGLPGWLERFKGCKHLVLSASVPLGFVGLGWMEKLLGMLRPHSPHLDDLRDQWRSPAHQEEGLRLLGLLANFSLRHRCRVTILSGECLLGAASMIRGGGIEMWQLISSGVTHPPLNPLTTRALTCLVRSPERLSDDFVLTFHRFNETYRRFIRTRTTLSLVFDPQNRLNAHWLSEGDPAHYNMVISDWRDPPHRG